ncbi:hypothetical protein GWI33_005208 [Rhynchophorus ferrugineus]|uniref:FAD synthase n=1 Tax=Rhynchophorus ferrugineus TaxID=354439 RepID=A0A834INF9_RHYFE|nr:hypothetical protein GWI33_005208 [Rhynchophorus ferrugineus]
MQLNTVSILVANGDLIFGESEHSLELNCIIQTLKHLLLDIRNISIIKEDEKSAALELTTLSKLNDFVIVLAKPNPICISNALGNITLQAAGFLPNRQSDIRIFILEFGYAEQQIKHILKPHLTHYKQEVKYIKFFNLAKNGGKDYIEKYDLGNVVINCEYTHEMDVITLTSNSFEEIVSSEIMLKEKKGDINGKWINEMVELIYHSKDEHVVLAIDVIEKCLQNYGLDNVFLSFNGGKDCTVLLHLVQTVIEKRYPDQKYKKLICLYIRSEDAFKDQDAFIEQCKIYFNLEIVTASANIKEALRMILEQQPHLKACFMGTRRTDPFSSHLTPFEITDDGWPKVMRCSPLLDWYYTDVWDYLLYYKVPYCKLYDYGYTSLGNTTNTIRNPSLLFSYGDEKDVYLPAYKMMVDKKERSGRNISKM